ncbi:hypothetical protein EDEG_01688 [Edhazardia aedis USNM 41457]|uniref:Uncharacterized protein n=1 Tax=Edhazardia aedis (strain USNM 41457) TaxID=1003232 RepID=J8ZWF3_EDHAE|nr:hypothetical protein EDEG_01688 [Edhazardia aedis USNM 41457]|eukprot:EJW04023.1 hypothetical protein EDEG_01688 [Edhazardia aedis USNM 41457]
MKAKLFKYILLILVNHVSAAKEYCRQISYPNGFELIFDKKNFRLMFIENGKLIRRFSFFKKGEYGQPLKISNTTEIKEFVADIAKKCGKPGSKTISDSYKSPNYQENLLENPVSSIASQYRFEENKDKKVKIDVDFSTNCIVRDLDDNVLNEKIMKLQKYMISDIVLSSVQSEKKHEISAEKDATNGSTDFNACKRLNLGDSPVDDMEGFDALETNIDESQISEKLNFDIFEKTPLQENLQNEEVIKNNFSVNNFIHNEPPVTLFEMNRSVSTDEGCSVAHVDMCRDNRDIFQIFEDLEKTKCRESSNDLDDAIEYQESDILCSTTFNQNNMF